MDGVSGQTGRESVGSGLSRRAVVRVAALAIAGGVLVAAVAVYAIGSALPVEHIAAVRGELPATREQVWETITDWPGQVAWRQDLAAVLVRSRAGGEAVWVEVDARGDSMTLATVEVDRPRRLVTRIADSDQPFGGTWTFELDDDGPGTYIRIVEQGEVYSPVFRFVAAVFIGHTATIETYLADLRRHLTESL